MKRADLIRALSDAARPLGYRRKGGLFWKTGPELTALVHLQDSRWGKGVYVNVGVVPTRAVTGPVPPPVGRWGVAARAEGIGSPFQERFRLLAMGDPDAVRAEDAAEAFAWLMGWIETHLADPDAVRRAVLDPSSWMSDALVYRVMRDWATGSGA